MRELTIRLADDEWAALDKAAYEHRGFYPVDVMARLLLRDELIRMGLLALPMSNRSRRAKRGR